MASKLLYNTSSVSICVELYESIGKNPLTSRDEPILVKVPAGQVMTVRHGDADNPYLHEIVVQQNTTPPCILARRFVDDLEDAADNLLNKHHFLIISFSTADKVCNIIGRNWG